VSEATGTAERDAALTMLERQGGRHCVTLGADKAYNAADFVADLRALHVTPHVAQNTSGRRSAIDGRTTRHPGCAVSRRCASGSRRASAGSRRPRACARPVTAAPRGSAGYSP
jgi:hypothetical protein